MADIIVAPFSNSSIRDWPSGHYAAMVTLLADRWQTGGTIRVVGTPSQRLAANDVVRHADPDRVVNACGRLSWNEVVLNIRDAACVIGNNSGIPHLASHFGVPPVTVFGGSHQRLEWRPRGFNVVTVTRAIACSPCHLDHNDVCPYDKACLRQIEPAEVVEATLEIMRLCA